MKLTLPYQNFEHTFLLLLKEANTKPIPIHTFLTVLSGKGKLLLLVFLSLGFAQIPGIAMVLGLFITYLGIRIAIGGSFIWMPKSLLHKEIPSYFLTKIINQILRRLKFMKRWSRPRYEKLTQGTIARIANGLMIALVGLGLALCPPVPLPGLLASLAIFLIAIGLLNHDGVYIIFGYISALCYLAAVALLLNYFSFKQIVGWIKNLIS